MSTPPTVGQQHNKNSVRAPFLQLLPLSILWSLVREVWLLASPLGLKVAPPFQPHCPEVVDGLSDIWHSLEFPAILEPHSNLVWAHLFIDEDSFRLPINK
jgi:hypothetical protein